MKNNLNHEIDPDLKKKLKAYGESAPQRNPNAARRGRDRFMAELDKLPLGTPVSNSNYSTSGSIFAGLAAGLKQLKENLAMSFMKRSTMTFVTTILVLVVFLFGGGGITAYAAGAALPGDALYPVKTGIENARAGFAGNSEAQARLFLGFAGKRLGEIQALIADGRFSSIKETAGQFEKDIQKALDAIQKLSQTDPARAAILSADAAKILKGYSDTLSVILNGAPADVQPVIANAISASNSAAEIEDNNANGSDDNSNINDNGNANGNDDNSNINDDSNANGSDDNSNINDNSNANGNDDNSNINDNGNANGNDDNSNINDNSNANGSDDNSNSNINDNGNINDNSNSNSNINDNSNSNGNSNDNSGGGSGSGGNSNDNSGGGGSGGSGGNGNGNDSGGSGHGGSKP